MEKEIKQVINSYKSFIPKFYVFSKYILTPFAVIDASLPKKGRIIDIGCGNGMYSFYLYFKSNKRQITGVDNNKKKIKNAKKIATFMKDLKFSLIDLNGEYSLDEYDGYLINDVLHHIPHESKQKLLKKIYSVMGEKSVLVIKEIHDNNKLKFLLNFIIDKIMTTNQKLYFINDKELLKMTKDVGFIVSCKKINGFILPHIIYVCKKYG